VKLLKQILYIMIRNPITDWVVISFMNIFKMIRYRRKRIKIGAYCTLRNVSMEFGVAIGNYCRIENASVGYRTYIAPHADISDIKFGKYCSIGPGLKTLTASHPIHELFSTHPIFYNQGTDSAKAKYFGKIVEVKDIEIMHDVWIGGNVLILGGVVIPTGVVVGAGSVVTKSPPPYSVIAGNPAKVIKFRFPSEVISMLRESNWWEDAPEFDQNKFSDLQRIIHKND